jgi:hypothetical protein
MTIDITHTKDPLAGWDVDVTVAAEGKETIARVQIEINGFSKCDEQVSPPARKWHRQMTQQGQYPGENRVVVTATDSNGEDTSAVDEWS